MPGDTGPDAAEAVDSKPNLAMGYRVAAIVFGGLGILFSPLALIISIPGALFFFSIMFLFFYIGVTGDQTSWAAKLLKALGGVFT